MVEARASGAAGFAALAPLANVWLPGARALGRPAAVLTIAPLSAMGAMALHKCVAQKYVSRKKGYDFGPLMFLQIYSARTPCIAFSRSTVAQR